MNDIQLTGKFVKLELIKKPHRLMIDHTWYIAEAGFK